MRYRMERLIWLPQKDAAWGKLFGWRFGWMTVYLIESMIFALFLRMPMGVTV